MSLSKPFQAAFFISVAIHLVIISQGIHPVFSIAKERPQKIEIRYIKAPKQEKENLKIKKQGSPPNLNAPLEMGAEKRVVPQFTSSDEPLRANKQLLRKEPSFSKPALIKPEAIIIKKRVSLPPVDMAKIDNPLYLNYYQIVREKIRRAAYQSYSSNETGEVYITFIISNEGFLRDVRLVEEKTSASIFLREIALASVKNASPFPKFPKDLDYSRLSFNVVISFEIE